MVLAQEGLSIVTGSPGTISVMSQYPTFPPPDGDPTGRPFDGASGETEPLPGVPAEASDRTSAYESGSLGPPPPPYAGPSAGPAGAYPGATPSPTPTRRGRAGFAAAVVATSLLVGGGAGFGGAAAYSALSEDGNGGNSSQVRTSQVSTSAGDAEPQGAVAAVSAKVLPSVVKLDVSGRDGQGSGSGIIVSSDGEILTNNHVAEVGADGGSITVSFDDGTKAPAEVLGLDPLTDTALIKAEGVSGLTPIALGESQSLQVGENVVAVGSPFGLDATVTSGIVSALNRPVDVGRDAGGNTTAYPAIQTDAAINPGNSGGPLVDLEGNLVGVNSSIRSTGGGLGGEAGSIGLGFAIPIDEVMPIVEQMRAGETPTHARLGITVSNVGDPTGADVTEGAVIKELLDGSTGAKAGLEVGDVITRVDDRPIAGSSALVATIRSYRPGDEVTLTYVRDGSEKTAKLTLDSDEEATSS